MHSRSQSTDRSDGMTQVGDRTRGFRVEPDLLGFEKRWHAAGGSGTVCQVNHGDCEIILAEDAARSGTARLFIEGGRRDARRHGDHRCRWDRLLWLLYDTRYTLLEAWERGRDDYRTAFDAQKYIRPPDMRRGRQLFSVIESEALQ